MVGPVGPHVFKLFTMDPETRYFLRVRVRTRKEGPRLLFRKNYETNYFNQ